MKVVVQAHDIIAGVLIGGLIALIALGYNSALTGILNVVVVAYLGWMGVEHTRARRKKERPPPKEGDEETEG